jgi:hypothetical protein
MRTPATGGYLAMNPFATRPNYLLLILLATPFVAFAVYIACLIIPVVVSAVVPAVVEAVTTSSN